MKDKDRIEGIVTSVKRSSNSVDNLYTVMTGEASLSFRCGIVLGLMDKVAIAKLGPSSFVDVASIAIDGKAKKKEYSAMLKKALSSLGFGRAASFSLDIHIPVKELEKATERMSPQLKKAAAEFAKRVITGTPIVARFHNDCDGASGAIAVHTAVADLQARLGLSDTAVTWRINRSVVYSEDAYYSDYSFISSYESVEKPMVFITDFGTMDESEPAIRACSEKYSMVWLDHHPVYKGFPSERIEHYINTWNFGSDSDYTAGFLACIFAQHIAKIDTRILMGASLISDFSIYGKRNDPDAGKMAAFLDFMTGKRNSVENLTPKYLLSIISDRERFNEISTRAMGLMNEALELGVRKVRHQKMDGFTVFVLDFESIKSGDDFPLPGRYSSRLQDRLQQVNGVRALTMVHYGSYISIRSDRSVAAALDLHPLIAELQKENGHILSFGGHGPALSIRIDKDHVDEVVDMLLTMIASKRIRLR